ncbi:MAG TPA: site-specific DNA-methyltransferase [Phycisphaerae bacterium]|nr:site-specific DNA-methyltransferase [Phycisphaerae bacterium]HPS51991.1 site-specific DNA-methyltransferase [Phycisphaerae bacterium]
MTKVGMNVIEQGDCIKILDSVEEPFADLVFADPPFNIGYKYDVYEDKLAYEEYYDWTEKWMAACTRVMKPDASFWIAIGAEYAAEVRLIGRKLGLTLRNWIIWHYTFGQNTKKKFARSHTHLFYFVKDSGRFTFNDKAVRVFSDREVYYHDKRANPQGRIPDDVWDEFPRLCGSFSEREGWHPCQMPESLLARIIRTCSNVGDVVIDPFAGSGTTLVAAKKLSRRYFGTEISPQYVEGVRQRLNKTRAYAGGCPEKSQPADCSDDKIPPAHFEILRDAYADFTVPVTKLKTSGFLMERFAERYNLRLKYSGVACGYTAQAILGCLEKMSKKIGALPVIKCHSIDGK